MLGASEEPTKSAKMMQATTKLHSPPHSSAQVISCEVGPFLVNNVATPYLPIDIVVWKVKLDLNAALSTQIISDLDLVEQARLDRYRRHADRIRFAISRVALKAIIKQHCPEIKTKPVHFNSGPFGKLFMPSMRLNFNLSHSGSWTYIVLSTRRNVGIDVEQVNSEVINEDLIRSALTAQEIKNLPVAPIEDRIKCFYQYWTRKESALKALGLGISYGLQNVTILPTPRSNWYIASTLATKSAIDTELKALTIVSLPVSPGYMAALAFGPES